MTAQETPIGKHMATAKEHLAGIKAAAKWREELIAAHLLDTQQPIKDQPVGAVDEAAG